MYTFEQLKADVKTEADNLKVHATKEELGRLNIKSLRPDKPTRCVYGLTTGLCDSDRAIELLQMCAPVFFKSFSTINNLTPAGKIVDDISGHWSPIELYIGAPEAKNANLIAYLKGETETLEL